MRRSAAWMSAAGSNRVKVVHRKFIVLAAARAGSSVKMISGQSRNAGSAAMRAGASASSVRGGRRGTLGAQCPANNETPATEHAYVGDAALRRGGELMRQRAHRLPQSE